MRAPIDKFIPKKYPDGSITQWFGENPDLYKRWGLVFHNGVDIVAPHGTPLYAVESGVISGVKSSPDGYGKHVRFKHPIGNKRYREWIYGHMDTIAVKEGDRVKEGDLIGTMGNTGFVISGNTPFWKYNPYAGTHVHFGLRIYDDKGVVDYNNGVFGSIDPMPFISHEYADTIDKQLTLISVLNTLVNTYKQLIAIK